ncbi:putative gustatory receptor 28b [Schistocerca piceifrons]|uniref:putative gustatory receptor 28b n=1 Tax=Schistocerca piceifrons TaxID=274613 RepID=UPI001F5FDB46|nr:putative gustatory receptor 28b [Schistocerca piceifrons]
MHSLLIDIARVVNSGYGVQNAVEITSSFVHVVMNCYMIFVHVLEFADPLVNESKRHTTIVLLFLPWTIMSVLRIVSIVYSCEVVVQEASRTEQLVNKLLLLSPRGNSGHHVALKSFAQQMSCSRLSYSAAGLFSIDKPLLTTWVAATTTYLVILVQFGLNDSSHQ